MRRFNRLHAKALSRNMYGTFLRENEGQKDHMHMSLKNPSPWITAHSDVVVKGIEELEEALKSLRF